MAALLYYKLRTPFDSSWDFILPLLNPFTGAPALFSLIFLEHTRVRTHAHDLPPLRRHTLLINNGAEST